MTIYGITHIPSGKMYISATTLELKARFNSQWNARPEKNWMKPIDPIRSNWKIEAINYI